MIHIFVDGEQGQALFRHTQRCGVPEPVLHLEAWDEARALELITATNVRAVVLPLERLSPAGLRRVAQRKTRVTVVGFQLSSHADLPDGISWGADLASQARAGRMLVWDEQNQRGGFFAVNSMGFSQLQDANSFDELAQVTARYLKLES